MLNSYKVLGIERDASAAQVRLAYIRLMKLCHPDAPGSDEASEEIARDVNRAFWTLRDPARRAEHDRLLSGKAERAPRRAAEVRVAAAYVRAPSARPQRAGRVLGVAVGMAAFLSLGAFAYAQPQRFQAFFEQPPAIGMAAAAEAQSLRAAAADDVPDIESWHIHGAVADLRQMVIESGMRPVEAYSRRCFAELTVAPAYPLLDHCVAFDTAAALIEAPMARRGSLPSNPFFQQAARESRQRSSALLLTGDTEYAEQRRREVEQQTVSAMANYQELSVP